METALKTPGEARPDAEQGAEAAAGAPPLGFIQIAFAGHNRADDLGEPGAIAGGLKAAWTMLQAAGVAQARLLTGFAGGADTMAVETWRAAGLGAVQAVLPFLDDEDARSLPDELSGSATLLDGVATRAIRRSPHLAQTRWLIGAADLLVAVWTGQPPRGSGGTADAVRLAVDHGVPVLWIQPGEPSSLRLIRPEFLFEDSGFLEFLEQLTDRTEPLVTDATPERLRAALCDLGLADPGEPAGTDEAAPRRSAPLAWPWRAYSGFRRLFGGRGQGYRASAPPPDLAAQAGFARLSAARAAAAEEAKRLGAIHRSQQVILLGIAIAMATAGSATALLPAFKLHLVAVELALAVAALMVWVGSERRERHLKWGEARRRAEDLRLERAAWTLGVSTVPHGLTATNTKGAREARRLAGLPCGRFDAARVESWGAWALDELLTGQAAYHRDQSAISGRISHRVHVIENASFAALLVLLGAYIIVTLGLEMTGNKAPGWLGGVVYMAGAIVPALGAAGLALEATLSLGDQARRSRVLAGQLEALRAEVGTRWTLEDLQGVARTAIRLERAQEEHWTADAGRRRLFRGG